MSTLTHSALSALRSTLPALSLDSSDAPIGQCGRHSHVPPSPAVDVGFARTIRYPGRSAEHRLGFVNSLVSLGLDADNAAALWTADLDSLPAGFSTDSSADRLGYALRTLPAARMNRSGRSVVDAALSGSPLGTDALLDAIDADAERYALDAVLSALDAATFGDAAALDAAADALLDA